MTDKRLSEEIQAMATIEEAFAPLEGEARRRVLSWAVSRYGLELRRGGGTEGSRQGGGPQDQLPQYETVADLFAAAAAQTDADRALVVGYWLQIITSQPDFDSFTVNRDLKNLGHGVANITSAFDTLIERKPQHVIQTRKSGSAKQARKRYKLTEEGKKAVQRMVAGTGDEE